MVHVLSRARIVHAPQVVGHSCGTAHSLHVPSTAWYGEVINAKLKYSFQIVPWRTFSNSKKKGKQYTVVATSVVEAVSVFGQTPSKKIFCKSTFHGLGLARAVTYMSARIENILILSISSAFSGILRQTMGENVNMSSICRSFFHDYICYSKRSMKWVIKKSENSPWGWSRCPRWHLRAERIWEKARRMKRQGNCPKESGGRRPSTECRCKHIVCFSLHARIHYMPPNVVSMTTSI